MIPHLQTAFLSMAQALDPVLDLDSDLLLVINGLHSTFFDTFMMFFSSKWIWFPMYAALIYALYKSYSLRHMAVCVVFVALLVLVTDQFASSVLKGMVGRLRPANLLSDIGWQVHVVDGYRGGRYGFPSSHAANTFGLAFFLFFLFKRNLLHVFLFVWAAVCSYSRMYLGVHYPGDILGGILLGLLVAWVLSFVFRRVCRLDHRTEMHRPAMLAVLAVGLLTVLFILVCAWAGAPPRMVS